MRQSEKVAYLVRHYIPEPHRGGRVGRGVHHAIEVDGGVNPDSPFLKQDGRAERPGTAARPAEDAEDGIAVADGPGGLITSGRLQDPFRGDAAGVEETLRLLDRMTQKAGGRPRLVEHVDDERV